MTLDKARELVTVRLQLADGYNRNAVRLIFGEVQRAHGRPAARGLLRALALESVFGLKPGTDFSGVGR